MVLHTRGRVGSRRFFSEERGVLEVYALRTLFYVYIAFVVSVCGSKGRYFHVPTDSRNVLVYW